MSDVVVAVLYLVGAFVAGWYARGHLDRLFVQTLLARRLGEDIHVTLQPAGDRAPSRVAHD